MSKSSQQHSAGDLAALSQQLDTLKPSTPPSPTVSIGPDEFMVAAYGDAGRRAVAHVAGQPGLDPKP